MKNNKPVFYCIGLGNGNRDAAYVVNEDGEVLFRYGTTRECFHFIGDYTKENKIPSFIVIDPCGERHEYLEIRFPKGF